MAFTHTVKSLRAGLLPAKRVQGWRFASQHAAATSTIDAPVEGGFKSRMVYTGEVLVSKIFPAGFGWQYASGIAESAGFAADTAGFALITGLGDGLGVGLGHTLYYTGKKYMVDGKIDLKDQRQLGLWLGSAAVMSGTVWQPTVNALVGAGLTFNPVAAGTCGACTVAFLVGLRMGRKLYGSLGNALKADSLSKDAQLSLSVGGATAAFVGTDISVAGNWLKGIVGIGENASVLGGSATAGSSTAMGFAAFQGVQNAAVPKNKAWTDI